MNFLYPTFLFALFAITIPIIIHLFNFRKYKTVYFSNVAYLKNVKQETKAKSQLKHWLLLLCRILVVISLVLAFARPFIPVAANMNTAENAKTDLVSIYIDNSFSMDSEGENGQLIELAKKRALSIAEAYQPNSKFILQTNDFEVKHQRYINQEQFSQYVEEIRVSPNIKTTDQLISRQQDLMSIGETDLGKVRKTNYLISDFQKNTTNFQAINTDSATNYVLMPIAGKNINNLYIDSCWFDSPTRKLHQSETLFVKIINNSKEGYSNIPIKFFINDSIKSLGSFNIEANGEQTIEMSFTNTNTGNLKGKVEITDYPVTFDNIYYLSYTINTNISVLSIFDSKKELNYIPALFADDEYIKHTRTNSDNIKTSQVKNQDVIILDGIKTITTGIINELSKFISEGGTLIFFPNMNGNKEAYNQLLSEFRLPIFLQVDSQDVAISEINYSSEIFRNVFKKKGGDIAMPKAFKHFKVSKQQFSLYENILATQNGDEILNYISFNKGKIFVFTTSTNKEASMLAKHPIFVPLVYNAVLYSSINSKLAYTIGNNELVELNGTPSGNNSIFHFVNKENDIDFIPNIVTTKIAYKPQLKIKDDLKHAGNYLIFEEEKEIQAVSFNFNRKESDLKYYTEDELGKIIQQNKLLNFSIFSSSNSLVGNKLSEINTGHQLWFWFIVLAIVFLGIEIILVRLWR